MTIDEKKQILNLHKQGLSISKIIKITGYSRSTISRFLNSYKEEDLIDKLIGQKFNHLTVIKQVESKNNKSQYLCQCDCGNTTIVQKGHLISGHTKSCGCLRQTINDGEDLTDQRFCKLVAKNRIRQNNTTFWECQCDCGNIHYVRTGDLISGRVKSCGCLKSFGEQQIILLLNKFNISYKKEYSFTDLKGNARYLRFDFAIFMNNTLNCLIEYQGEQHYDINNKWYNEIAQQYDNKKREYCIKNNLPLYEFTKDTNIELKLLEILKERGLIND